MGILIDPTLPDRDWSGLVKPTTETVGHLLSLSFGGAASSALESIKAFRTRKENIGQRAWTLWRESLALALDEFFKTASLTREPGDEELKQLLAGVLEGSKELCEKGNVELTAPHLKYPPGFGLYRDVREKLPAWARQVAPEHLRKDGQLRRRLDRAFAKGFHRARFEGGEHFKPIREYLYGDGSEAIERQDYWVRYNEWLRAEVEDRPMFGQEADGPTLEDIFVPLRCTWREWPRDRRGRDEDDGDDQRTTVHVCWLLEELQAWLAKADKRDVLRVVTGGPGCGKSSTAKMFACDVARTDDYSVFLVPLHGLDVSRDVASIVSDYVDDARHNSSSLPDSPINWVRHDPKPLLLIFDGLDEVAREDGAGLEVTRQFLESLRVWLGRVNDGADLKVMALTLGRPQAAEEAASKIGGLDGPSLLYVEPLCALNEAQLKRGSLREMVVDDPGKVASGDHRRRFWDDYARFDSRYRDAEPVVLNEEGLSDLTIEPLLLYLLMYSGLAGKEWPEAKENRNRIYEAIFAEVHERDRKEKPGLAVEGQDDFFTLMECLGLAAWLGGGRTGNDEDFEYIRDEIYAPDRKKVFADLDQARLKNVAVQFYTHQGGRDQPGYAFIHKSFGEYLAARALIKASEIWCEEYGKRNRWDSFAEDWFRLAGRKHITREILAFMIDEARLRVKKRCSDRPDFDYVRKLIEQLCEVVNLTIDDGIPAHRVSLASNAGVAWRNLEAYQRNAEMALYAAVHAWAEVGYPRELIETDPAEDGWQAGPIKIGWPKWAVLPAIAVMNRVRGHWADEGQVRRIFARWDFGSQQLVQFYDLKGADLFGANLDEANLSGTYLNGANLGWAYLKAAYLRGAYLNGANLVGACLEKANLHRADLIEANMDGTNLRGAYLNGANLRGADCSRMEIDSAHLDSADLSETVNLTQEQINLACGNSKTKLPVGLVRPAHWKDDE